MPEDEKKRIASDPNYVLNGIAYDQKSDLSYLTGKRWKTIFVGRFIDRP